METGSTRPYAPIRVVLAGRKKTRTSHEATKPRSHGVNHEITAVFSA